MAKPAGVGDRIVLRLSVDGEWMGRRVENRLKSWAAAGMSKADILARLRAELSPGGAMYDQFVSAFKNSAGEVVDYVSVEQVHEEWDGEDWWTWIAVDDDARCEDCADRDGESKTWADWEGLGLPGMGTTRCGWRCRCSLEPAEVVAGMADADYPGVQ